MVMNTKKKPLLNMLCVEIYKITGIAAYFSNLSKLFFRGRIANKKAEKALIEKT